MLGRECLYFFKTHFKDKLSSESLMNPKAMWLISRDMGKAAITGTQHETHGFQSSDHQVGGE